METNQRDIIILAGNTNKGIMGVRQIQPERYIATACYGSYDCTQVVTFRHFRDEYLSRM
jgi:hypothetical protein